MELKPFDKVLVRFNEERAWTINFFSHIDQRNKRFPYCCIDTSYAECIQYKGNEHLLGTINPYIPKWEPKRGELVLATISDDMWFPAFFDGEWEDNELYPYSVFKYKTGDDEFEKVLEVHDIKPFKQEDM